MILEDLKDVNTLTEKEFGWVLRQIPLLRAWASTVESTALRRLLDGKKVAGFKLVSSRSNRRWIDVKKAFEKMQAMKLDVNLIAPRTVLSPAQAEKLFKRLKKKKEWGTIAKLMERPQGKLSIAPVEDPRPEAQRGHEFADVSEDDDSP